MNNIGLIYWDRGDADKTIEYLMKAKKINDRLGTKNTHDYADLLYNMGCVFLVKKDLGKAERCYAESWRIRKKLRRSGK